VVEADLDVSVSRHSWHTVGASGDHAPSDSRHLSDLQETVDIEDTMMTLLKYRSVPGKFNEASQVVSYGQLYIQALLVHGILRGKVEEWALKSQGYLPVIMYDHDNDEWKTKLSVKWREVAETPSLAVWPCIKRSTRSFQKVARVYNSRVSRLLDVTRFSIFFDSIQDLTVSLQTIMIDPSIQLLRVKNSLAFGMLPPLACHARLTRVRDIAGRWLAILFVAPCML